MSVGSQPWEEGLEDLLEESSYSQLGDSMTLPDLDSILRPLSDSQQAKEDDLDMRDLQIREGESATLEEGMLPVRKEKALSVSIRRAAPGLPLLHSPPFLVFTELSLESDLGWEGRGQVLQCGLSPALLDQILTDRIELVRRLAPETGQSFLISGQQEFGQVADFLFYSATACGDRLAQAMLEKALLDLLWTTGFRWQLTTSHVATVLLNLGLDSRLLETENDSNLELPQFYTRRIAKSVSRSPVTLTARRRLLGNTLGLVTRLLTLDTRHSLRESNSDRLLLMRMFVLLGLDRTIVDDPKLSRLVKLLLHSLLDLTPRQNRDVMMQDFAELVLVHLPTQLELPSHSHHPHNMLALCRLMPSSVSGCRLRRLLSYLSIQLVLGVQQPDLPWDAGLPDLWSCLTQHSVLWRAVSRVQHYSTYCVLGMMDLMYSGHYTDHRPDSDHCIALRGILGLLQDYRDRGSRHDTLDLDPVFVVEAAGELSNRWRLALHTAENLHSLRLKTGNSGSQSGQQADV